MRYGISAEIHKSTPPRVYIHSRDKPLLGGMKKNKKSNKKELISTA
jgi:hypothetical protein